MRKVIYIIFFAFLSIFANVNVACKENVVFYSVEHFFDMRIKDTDFKTQVALYDYELSKGLMYRKSLGEKESMVFVYPSARRVSFWMKNTEIPLDIAFIDEAGKILEIKSMYPHDLTSVPSTSDKVMYCLEVNRGFFYANKINIGDSLDMQLLKKAIDSRR